MNLRLIFLSILITISFSGMANNSDRLIITVNNKEVYNRVAYAKTYVDTLLLRYIKVGDTMRFELTTDWEAHKKSQLLLNDFMDNNVAVLYGNEGRFTFILKSEHLLMNLNLRLIYGEERQVKPWELVISKNYKRPLTQLTIIQGIDSILISDTLHQLKLRPEPFKLVFTTKNTTKIFLSANFDSTAYHQAIKNQSDSLSCFHENYAYLLSTHMNADLNLMITNGIDDGFRILHASFKEPEYSDFDGVRVEKNEWIGVRTVNSLWIKSEKRSLDNLVGKHFYIVYSPGLEKEGHALKIIFG